MATNRPVTGNRPYSGRARPSRAPGPGEGFDAPTPAERKRLDAEQSAPYRDSYEQGREDVKRQPARPKKRPPAKRRAPQSVRTASRQLAAPVRAQVTGGLRLTGMALGLVALYAVLTSAPAFSGVLNGIAKGLDWLAAPNRTIPRRT